jgi:hypothetical protein
MGEEQTRDVEGAAMRRRLESGHGRRIDVGPGYHWLLGTVFVLLATAWPATGGAGVQAQESSTYTPATGHAEVIAQGVVALPNEEVAWRTVRYRAEPAPDAPFAEQPLSFVVASTAAILLVDQATAAQTRLGPGEAALVPAGTIQQRASLSDTPAGYLAIELVPAGAPDAAGTVLQEGQAFVASAGLHDLDLMRDVLTGDETLTVPNTGEKNLILVTEGALGVGRPDQEPATLLAGEAATFDGELAVGVAVPEGAGTKASDRDSAAFVVAVIGPAVAPPALPPPAATTAPPEATTAPPTTTEAPPNATTAPPVATTAGTETGSITIQVANCPSGMRPENLRVAICEPATGDFDVTLSSDQLETPLTLDDAVAQDGSYTWSDLPYGQYLLAEAVLPEGNDTYIVSAKAASGGPETGYTITVDASAPKVRLKLYNFQTKS